MVERVKIQDVVTGVPLILANNRVYKLQVITPDGRTYSFGLYVTGVEYSTTLKIRNPGYSDQAHATHDVVTVEARRSAGYTPITVTNGATLVKVNVRYRNGTVAWTDNSTSQSVTFTWSSAVNTTDYMVDVNVTHAFFGSIRYRKYLKGLETFTAFPDLAVFGDWGGVDAGGVYAVLIILAVAGMATYANMALGMITAIVLTGCMILWGAVNMSYDTLALIGGLAILFGLALGRSKG